MLSKDDLRTAIAPTNRGIAANAADKQAIASIIAQIEDRNPTPDPLSATDLLEGDWRLLYTTSQELLGIDKVPLAQLGDIYQCVRTAQSRIYNIAEVKGLPYLESLVSVVASFAPAADANDEVSAMQLKRRVNVKFNRAVLGLQRSLGYQSPAQ